MNRRHFYKWNTVKRTRLRYFGAVGICPGCCLKRWCIWNTLERWIIHHEIGSPWARPSSSTFGVKIEVKVAEPAAPSWPSGKRIQPKIFGDLTTTAWIHATLWTAVHAFMNCRWRHDSRRLVPTPTRRVVAWVCGFGVKGQTGSDQVQPEEVRGKGEGKEEVNTHVPVACSWSSGHSVSSGRSRCSSRRTEPHKPPRRSRWSSRSSWLSGPGRLEEDSRLK